MPYRPRHQAQLGRGIKVPGRTQGSRDCAFRSIQVGLDYLTKGRKRPTVKVLRKRAGTPGPQAVNVWEVQKAVEASGEKFHIKRNIQDAKDAVANGRAVFFGIDYRAFNDLAGRTGDPKYTGGHAVVVCDQKRNRKGQTVWLLYDSLDDSRRLSIPQGARWVRRRYIVQSAVALSGNRETVYTGVFR